MQNMNLSKTKRRDILEYGAPLALGEGNFGGTEEKVEPKKISPSGVSEIKRFEELMT